MRILNQTQQTILAQDTQIADTAMSRLVGLLNRKSMDPGEALVITQCRSIHMFFMKFAIDVVFVDRGDSVVGLVENIQPFQMSPYFLRSSYVIELPPGIIKESKTAMGDRIVFEKD